jgi:hypothetical protein
MQTALVHYPRTTYEQFCLFPPGKTHEGKFPVSLTLVLSPKKQMAAAYGPEAANHAHFPAYVPISPLSAVDLPRTSTRIFVEHLPTISAISKHVSAGNGQRDP